MARERTDTAAAPVESEDAAGVARVARLPLLVDALQGTDPEDRARIAGELNDLLIAMRAPGQEAAEAAVVQAALNAKKLHGMVDARGRSCRREAVETLLATGFPHALEVSPEDLAFARSFEAADADDGIAPEGHEVDDANPWRQQMSTRRKMAAVVGPFGSAVTVLAMLAELFTGSFGAAHAFSLVLALVSAWVCIAFSRRRTDTSDQGVFGAALAVTGLLQLGLAFLTGPWGLGAFGGTALALLVLFVGEDVALSDPPPGGG